MVGYDGGAVEKRSIKEVSEARLRDFVADAITAAGGTDKLAETLAQLGFQGAKGGAYNPGSIANWKSGTRQPDAEVVFALARRLDLSLDKYVFGEDVPPALPEIVDEHGRRLGELEGWLHELAASMGMELGDMGGGAPPGPNLNTVRMRREIEALKAAVEQLQLRQKEA